MIIYQKSFQSGGNYNYAETSDCLRRLGFSSIDNELKFYPDLKDILLAKV